MENLTKVPTHVAIIMDGNGRWAEKNNVNRLSGHNAGMLSMKEIIREADDLGIKYLTVYAFSTENWKRSLEEVSGIFKLLVKFIKLDLDELIEKNVKVNILGEYKDKLPVDAVNSVEKALHDTKDNTGMQFNIALNYGSRAEILKSVKSIAELIKENEISPLDITEETISSYLYTGKENLNIPDPEIIIRTSGEERLSNFLLWQAAYSEFFFTDTLWPDFSRDEFREIIRSYNNRERRFGGR